MTRHAEPYERRSSFDSRTRDAEGPYLWGFDALAIHAAWWRGRGVQCVNRNREFEAEPGAELYLLLEPDQIVTFVLDDLLETIVWSDSEVLYVRVVELEKESFKEEIVRSPDGRVTGVKRSYHQNERLDHRVVLTADAELADRWASASDRGIGRRFVRDAARGRRESQRVYGHCHDFSLPEGREQFFSWLVASWEDPHRVIEGIEPLKKGIIGPVGASIPEGMICTEPAWLGFGLSQESPDAVLVGPDFLEDRPGARGEDAPVGILPFAEIVPPRGRQGGRILPRQGSYEILKRIFDVAFSAAVLLLAAPVLLIVALAVVIDDGFPVFFGHQRQMRGGREFRCWKFRTMRRDAEAMVARLKSLNKADGPQVFIENDPRVTRVGRILRRLQLDELPQFWNVLIGQMSIVGPRPSPDKENQFCPAWRELRLSVRPGITGLWQVERTRRPGEDFQEWIKYDIEYVRSASFRLDLKIILKTVWNILF